MRPPLTPDQLAGYVWPVHVEGWNPACVFKYVETSPTGCHHLTTPKTGRSFKTFNSLYPTKKNAAHTAHTPVLQ